MSEVKIYSDPKTYEPRTVFGVVTARTATTIFAAAVCAIPLSALLIAFKAPSDLISILIVFITLPIGAVGCGKIRGLRFEVFAPILLRSWATPKSTLWVARTWSDSSVSTTKTCSKEKPAPVEVIPEICDPNEFSSVFEHLKDCPVNDQTPEGGYSESK